MMRPVPPARLFTTAANKASCRSLLPEAPPELIIPERPTPHDVVEVDPSAPITDRYDVLLAVQPSTLTPPQMANFIAAVKGGQPTAIFEDPFPLPNFFPNVAGTVQPKRPPQSPTAAI